MTTREENEKALVDAIFTELDGARALFVDGIARRICEVMSREEVEQLIVELELEGSSAP